MADSITMYWSSISSNREIKHKQQKICSVLEAKKIPFEKVDIAASEEYKDRMRELCGDPTALPPKLFKGERYLGDYDAFEDAIETESLPEFLSM